MPLTTENYDILQYFFPFFVTKVTSKKKDENIFLIEVSKQNKALGTRFSVLTYVKSYLSLRNKILKFLSKFSKISKKLIFVKKINF